MNKQQIRNKFLECLNEQKITDLKMVDELIYKEEAIKFVSEDQIILGMLSNLDGINPTSKKPSNVLVEINFSKIIEAVRNVSAAVILFSTDDEMKVYAAVLGLIEFLSNVVYGTQATHPNMN